MKGIIQVDYFRKISSDHIKTTLTGSFLSIFAISCMVILMFSEFYNYFKTDIHHSMLVDTGLDPSENVPVNIDITIHDTPCSLVALDVGMQNRLIHVADVPLTKTRLNSVGEPVNGPATTYDINQIRSQIISKEQCRLSGSFKISKAQGDFHFGNHPKANLFNMIESNLQRQCRFSYTLHHLSFGDKETIEKVQYYFPEQAQTISFFDGYSLKTDQYPQLHAHNIKITPMVFLDSWQYEYRTYGFYMHSRSGENANHRSSSIYFLFDFEGVSEKYEVVQKGFLHLLVNVSIQNIQMCAIIGGVFVVIGIFNSIVQKLFSSIKIRSS